MDIYESKNEPVASAGTFYRRMLYNMLVAWLFLMVFLAIGIAGYHYIAGAAWIDAVHNAAMILSGMGPVIEIRTTAGKLFSSAYALFSGVAFITNIGLILAPAAHRLFHRLHVQDA